MKDIICLDLETGAETDDKLALVEPEFKAPSNYRDTAKCAEYVTQKRADWLADAALFPLTGRILTAGWGSPDGGWNISGVGMTDRDDPAPITEQDVIDDVFELARKAMSGSFHIAGFSIFNFDLPFLVKRAMILGVRVPFQLRPNGQSRFYWPPCFIDLQQVWGCGELHPKGSLDDLCRLMGFGAKLGSGKDFARLYLNPETQHKAIAYQMDELPKIYKLAERLLQ